MTIPTYTDWPRDPTNGRLMCTPAKPMPEGAPGQWAHTNISCVLDEGDYEKRRCDDCGVSWWEEIAQ